MRKLVPHYECFLRCAPKLVEPTDRDSFVKFAQDTYEGLIDNDVRTYIGYSEENTAKWEEIFDQEPEIEEVVMEAIKMEKLMVLVRAGEILKQILSSVQVVSKKASMSNLFS